MNTVEVGFSKPVGFAPEGWIVMWLERTKFSHAFVRVYLKEFDRSVIYQATGLSVSFSSEEVFASQHVQVESYKFQVDDEDVKRVVAWAIDNCGKPYSYSEALGLGIKRILKRLGIKIKNPFAQSNAYVCSTLVAEALHWAGIAALNSPEDVDLVTLSRMVRRLSAST